MWSMLLCSALYSTVLPLLADYSERESVNRDVFFITGPFSFVKTHQRLSQPGCKLFSAVLPKSAAPSMWGKMCERKIDHPPGPLQRLRVCVGCDKDHRCPDTQSLLCIHKAGDKAFPDRGFKKKLFLLFHLYKGISLFISFWKIWFLSISFLQLLITSAKSALQKEKKSIRHKSTQTANK